MQYSVLGPTGVKVSRICLGTATFGVAPSVQDADRIVGTALDLGINFVDTADVYGNMPVFDRPGAPPPTAANPPSKSSTEPLRGRRDETVIATESNGIVGFDGNDRACHAGTSSVRSRRACAAWRPIASTSTTPTTPTRTPRWLGAGSSGSGGGSSTALELGVGPLAGFALAGVRGVDLALLQKRGLISKGRRSQWPG